MDWIEMDLFYVKLLECLRARTRTVSLLYITVRFTEQYENESAGIRSVFLRRTRALRCSDLIVCYCI